MKAVVLEKACKAEELMISEVPIPEVKPGFVLVKIKAFGINRSEIFTRQGDSPSVKLPRIIGIECVGEIENPSDSTLQKGQFVVSLMGGLGRDFDGSYAEYARIPTNQVYPIKCDMDWIQMAAIPEMFYTAYASIFQALKLVKGETLLIRGGTSSIGLAALQLAKAEGITVISTTRNHQKIKFLKAHGADHVLIDDAQLSETLFKLFPNGVNKILELVGTATLKQSLKYLSEHGILCMTGILGGKWTLDHFTPMEDILSGTYFTQFDSQIIKEKTLMELFDFIEKSKIVVPIAKVFHFNEISEAHQYMESNAANGKIVVLVD